MSTRTDQRRAAVFALYQHDLTGKPVEDCLEPEATGYSRELAFATEARTAELDETIAKHSTGWTIDRIAPLEKNILRVALIEMLHPEEIPAHRPIPPEGAIDEAVETAKTYCGAQAPGFVNGVLDAVLAATR